MLIVSKVILKKKGCENMQDKIFHVGIYHLIISTIVLTKEEQDFLT